ncbi:SID1 transmembrane family member 1 [Papilio machaon]|uniref:SID1 transmembrane family member 1 n=1 Tax=Papilio machaon TaxID=76193 RepID=A0A194RN59_PAPMA|nr:SID1 transmembrane family member 1 [Papilio machaon]
MLSILSNFKFESYIYKDQDAYDTPARVTVASDFANGTYPLFITARQQKGVFSWQLPMLVQTPIQLEQFSNISRTLCPHNNIFSQDEDTCDLTTLPPPIVHLTTSSPDPISVTIVVETVKDFYIKLNKETYLNSTPSQPKYYFYPFDQEPNKIVDISTQSIKKKYMCNKELDDAEKRKLDRYFVQSNMERSYGWFSRPKSVIVMIESDDDICAVISIQNISCPVFDNERDILYDGYYLTMTRRGGITLTQDTFPLGFYIVFIVKTSDADCTAVTGNATLPRMARMLGWHDSNINVTSADGRLKQFKFKIIQTISYHEYVVAAVAALCFFLSFYVAFLIALVFQRKKTPDSIVTSQSEEGRIATILPRGSKEPLARRRRTVNTSEGSGSYHQNVAEDAQPIRTDRSSSSDTESDFEDTVTVENGDYHQSGRLCVANLSRCRPRVLSARSKMYLWNVLTVAIFYTLPVVQLVVTYQRLLNQSGNQDLCYFNFLCAHPLLVLSDFNHVYSNLGYVLLGALFLLQVWRRHQRHRADTAREVRHVPLHDTTRHGPLHDTTHPTARHDTSHCMKRHAPLHDTSRPTARHDTSHWTTRHVPLHDRSHCTTRHVPLHDTTRPTARHDTSHCTTRHVPQHDTTRPAARHDTSRCTTRHVPLHDTTRPTMGIPQHFGLLYAMGVALVSEGLLSAAYHVCPNSMNFQFDTSFMYVTSVLCMVKIYQARHPDINARAHATFGVLALIIFIGLVGVLNANFYFWVGFTVLHLFTCLVMTFQIYYLGRFRFDCGVLCRAVREVALRPRAAVTPARCGRCVLLLLANFANWALAAYGYVLSKSSTADVCIHKQRSKPVARNRGITRSTLTPAQSRQSNRVCSLLELYDSHDVWHFLSATAMFFSFNMYLTIDDNLADVPRTDIMVF